MAGTRCENSLCCCLVLCLPALRADRFPWNYGTATRNSAVLWIRRLAAHSRRVKSVSNEICVQRDLRSAGFAKCAHFRVAMLGDQLRLFLVQPRQFRARVFIGADQLIQLGVNGERIAMA